jgi:hypothetical protein
MWIYALSDAGSLAQVLEELLNSRRRQRSVVTARSPLEANEDPISRYVARSSSVDVLLEPAGESRNWDEPLTGLASHPQVQVAIPVDEIVGGEVDELTDPYAGVSQNTDDQLVALRHGDVFERLDLFSAEYLEEALGWLWKLRLALYWFAFGLRPGQEDVDRTQVAADRVPAQLCVFVAVLPARRASKPQLVFKMGF